ncbi:hypothetical protein BGX24_003690 [Mortierella sp. AD032]|nr:hypothetical protein BGX24_003690 [Mortierella sp. AD032]
MTPNIPRVILGTMTFGLDSTSGQTSVVRVRGSANVGPFLDTFHAHGHIEIDTARIYCNGDTDCSLPIAYRSFEDCNQETIKAIDDLYREGLFERFGLSNYSAWNVAQIYELCKQNKFVLPTVYQGMYNPIARSVTTELLPCLKYYNIGFYAFNPISGGMLSGKYKFAEDEVQEGGRYDPNTGFGKMFRDRYWTKTNFEAVQALTKVATENNLSLLEATLRWMRHHSSLTAKDGIIMGASTVAQLEESLTALDKGPLSEAMLKAFDDAWEHVKATTSWYFRGPDAPTFVHLLKNQGK